MGNKSSLMLQDEEISAIQNETGCKFIVDSIQIVTVFLIFQLVLHKLKDYTVDSPVWTKVTTER